MDTLTLAQALRQNYLQQAGLITEEQIDEASFSEWCSIVHSLFCTSIDLCKYTELSYAERKDTTESLQLYDYLHKISKMIGSVNGYAIRSLLENNGDILFMSYARTNPNGDELACIRTELHLPDAKIRKGSFTLFRFRCEKYFARQIIIQQLKSTDLLDAEQNDLRLIRKLKTQLYKKREEVKSKNSVPSVICIGFTTFVVRTNVMNCNKNHSIKAIRACVDVMSSTGIISREEFPAGYCENCQTYFILEHDFRTLREKGILLCQIISNDAYLSHQIDNQQNIPLKAESLLHQCGYNVNSADALTAIQRQEILKRVLKNQLYSKIGLLNFLDWLIARSSKTHKKDMSVALQKWKSDRDFVCNYDNDDAMEVQIGKLVAHKHPN